MTLVESATVRDFMTQDPFTLTPDVDVLRAMQGLVRRGISGAPVVDPRGNVVGILTERDCLGVAVDASYHQQPAGRVQDYMKYPVDMVSAEMPLIEVVERFNRGRFRRFPVLEGGRLVGMLSRRDILRAVLELWSTATPSKEQDA